MKPIITITANIKEATTAMQRLSFSVSKLAVAMMFSQEERFERLRTIAFWTVIGLNLICLTIAIVRL